MAPHNIVGGRRRFGCILQFLLLNATAKIWRSITLELIVLMPHNIVGGRRRFGLTGYLIFSAELIKRCLTVIQKGSKERNEH